MTPIDYGRIRKPKTAWLGIFSTFRPSQDEIPAEMAVLWNLANDIDGAAEWRQWWRPAGIPLLELRPLLAGEYVPFSMRQVSSRLVAKNGALSSTLVLESLVSCPVGFWDRSWVEAHRASIDACIVAINNIVYELLSMVLAELNLQDMPAAV